MINLLFTQDVEEYRVEVGNYKLELLSSLGALHSDQSPTLRIE